MDQNLRNTNARACDKLALSRYFSRVRTPKDNPVNERFNRTIQDEFINLGNFSSDPPPFVLIGS